MNKEIYENNQNDIPKNIGKPALRALENANIHYLEQLTSISQDELLKLHGVGPKAVRILGEKLAELGIDFAAPDQSIDISTEANKKIQRRY
jgi:DNA-directed RNA polymerase alpha subunit